MFALATTLTTVTCQRVISMLTTPRLIRMLTIVLLLKCEQRNLMRLFPAPRSGGYIRQAVKPKGGGRWQGMAEMPCCAACGTPCRLLKLVFECYGSDEEKGALGYQESRRGAQ